VSAVRVIQFLFILLSALYSFAVGGPLGILFATALVIILLIWLMVMGHVLLDRLRRLLGWLLGLPAALLRAVRRHPWPAVITWLIFVGILAGTLSLHWHSPCLLACR
jgi:hypothetical protein